MDREVYHDSTNTLSIFAQPFEYKGDRSELTLDLLVAVFCAIYNEEKSHNRMGN